MSDEDLELGNAIEADSAEAIEEPKKRKVFSDRMAKVLMFVAIGIVALLVSVTVSFLTYRFMDRGNRSRQFPVLSEEYSTEVPEYEIWTFLADDGYDLRTQTADAERYTVSAKIKLGYDEMKYKDLGDELTSKNDAVMDTIRFYFSQRTRSQLSDESVVKAELMSKINSLLSRGEIEQVWFLQYQIIGL
ncbi:MAG: flagellar basal body-associated FliL family protein [Spirochaetaceae bacterium]|nr:flagellar basal body-associated FliL family protein [Spirochaetaceae bacterium]MDT8298334.1 flagellar basal body-associated FliL family protein [Spirochaetaceae bacterium]